MQRTALSKGLRFMKDRVSLPASNIANRRSPPHCWGRPPRPYRKRLPQGLVRLLPASFFACAQPALLRSTPTFIVQQNDRTANHIERETSRRMAQGCQFRRSQHEAVFFVLPSMDGLKNNCWANHLELVRNDFRNGGGLNQSPRTSTPNKI